MTTFLAHHGNTIAFVIVALFIIGVSLYALSGYLRDLNQRAEEKRQRHDREAFLAALAAAQYAEERQADDATFAVAESFRRAMEQHPSAGDRMARIRAQIKANHEREVAAFRAEIDAWGGGAA